MSSVTTIGRLAGKMPVLLAVLVIVTSCDGGDRSPTAPTPSIAGRWLGSVSLSADEGFLDGFDICTTGSVVDFDQQGWVLTGTLRQEVGKCPIGDELQFTGTLEAQGTYLIGAVEEGGFSTRVSGPVFETQLILGDANGTRRWVLTR